MLWFKKNQKEELNSIEYGKLRKEILDINLNVAQMESLLFKIGADIKNLRGIMKKKVFDSIDEEIEEAKGLSNSVLLPEDGNYRFNRKRA
jgi:hypothetical protein